MNFALVSEGEGGGERRREHRRHGAAVGAAEAPGLRRAGVLRGWRSLYNGAPFNGALYSVNKTLFDTT